VLVSLIAAVGAVACAHQPDPSQTILPEDVKSAGQSAGFLLGLFHGVTMPFSPIGSLFLDVRVYQWPNSGGLYDLGFVCGAAAIWNYIRIGGPLAHHEEEGNMTSEPPSGQESSQDEPV